MKAIAKTLIVSAATYIALVATACAGDGKVIEDTKSVKDFKSVELAVPGKLTISQGSDFSFAMKGDEDFLKEIEVILDGDKLQIKRKSGFNYSFGNKKVDVFVTMPVVEGLSIAGSGDIEAATPISAKDLKTAIAGSGNIKITDLTVDNLKASIAGSGDVIINGKGNAQDLDASVAGSGDILVNGIMFNNAKISIAGSGNATIAAKESLKARVAGSGDIYYNGNPLVDAKISGSGTVKSHKQAIRE
jgi:hypothetical protein